MLEGFGSVVRADSRHWIRSASLPKKTRTPFKPRDVVLHSQIFDWKVEKLSSFEDFLARRFPESRRKAYYLMAIHENLTRIPKRQLREVGWSKAIELVKVARRDAEQFDCATWLHKARELPKEEFKGEVERHLTGKETERWEIIYFKLYKSQLPVVERAIDTAALMLGTDKSRGYCLEMICADFLAGANAQNEESGTDTIHPPSLDRTRDLTT